MELVLFFIAEVVPGGFFLWAAAKITKVDLHFRETVIAVTGAALASLIPAIGWLASIIALFYLLKYFSQADVWPDLILMVIVSRVLTIVTLMAFGAFP